MRFSCPGRIHAGRFLRLTHIGLTTSQVVVLVAVKIVNIGPGKSPGSTQVFLLNRLRQSEDERDEDTFRES